MAGTIPLSMTQQFTALGKPLTGGKLFLFQAATTTPQSAYSDTGLTTSLPNPLTLDSSGRVPQFFLADGTIKVRLTDKVGVIQAEWDNLLVIGPSGAGAGAGATVDPTTVFQTGMCIWLDQAGVLTGFVRDNARTIGSATSGATERANADTQALFTFLYTTYSDTICPVVGGRGASAAADWSANKQITLPDKRGYSPGGLDDMGNTAAGRYASVPVISGSVTTAGSVIGESLHTLMQTELPAVSLPVTVNLNNNSGISVDAGNTQAAAPSGASVNVRVAGSAVTIGVTSATTGLIGSGVAQNNVQKTVLGTYYRKL